VKSFSLSIFLSGSFLFAQQMGGPIQKSLDAMQQLRSLIPERNYEEMFNIHVHAHEFDLALEKQIKQSNTTVSIGPVQGYFLFATTSGETIRILDLYEQFQFSPYWHIPELLEELRDVEKMGTETDVLQ
jgi:hypothetical protein